MEPNWDKYNEKYMTQLQDREDWFAKYSGIIADIKSTVLELGCGQGNSTVLLVRHGLDVLATDISSAATEHTQKRCNVKIQQVDIRKKLPFDDESFELIAADLCLHYFTDKKTVEIMKEIKRILRPGGHLFARVNSTEDEKVGGEIIEKNLYRTKDGYAMRFFDMVDAKRFFGIIGDAKISKTEIKVHYMKKALEICVQKNKLQESMNEKEESQNYNLKKAKYVYGLYQAGLPFKKVYAVVQKDKKFAVLELAPGKKYKYTLSGGGVDDGEDNITAIKREVLEELNMNIEIIKSLGVFNYFRTWLYEGKSFDVKYIAEVFLTKFVSYADNKDFGLSGEFFNKVKGVKLVSKKEMLENVARFEHFKISF